VAAAARGERRRMTSIAAELPLARPGGAYRLSWVLLVLLVAGFVLKVGTPVLMLLGAALLVCGFLLMTRDMAAALCILPAIALLGPIVRREIGGGASLNLGDVYVLMLLIAATFHVGFDRPIYLGRHGRWLALVAALVGVSWVASIDIVASSVAMVGLVQLAVIYLLTLNFLREEDGDRVIDAWIWAVTLSSILVIAAYARGESLLLGSEATGATDFAALLASDVAFYRATFFVTGFIFPLGTMIVVLVERLYRGGAVGKARAALVGALLVDSVALLIMGNKTAMGAAALGALLVVGGMRFQRTRARRQAVLVMVMIAVTAGVIRAVQGVMADAQLQLLVARLSDQSSFMERLAVWRNVGEFLLRSPHALWVGLGPDVSVRGSHNPIFNELFMGNGFVQGAVDSGYLYVALNFGIVVLGVVAVVTLATLVRLAPTARRGDSAVARSAWLVLAVWTIMAATQQHGIAKPVALFVQCLALAELCLAARRSGGRLAPADVDDRVS
jgi:hypothetical protein